MLECLALIVGDQRLDDLIHIPLKNGFQLVKRQTDAVVGNPPLGEILGADALTAVTAADLAPAVLGALLILLADHLV